MMNSFMKFYKWGIEVKLYMSIYTLGLLCAKCVVELTYGNTMVSILVIFEMLVASFIASLLQWGLFPANAEFERKTLIHHTALWALLTNALLIGSAVVFHWFDGIPAWGGAVLVLLLELTLAAMWFAFYIVQRIDTCNLNDRLTAYQKK